LNGGDRSLGNLMAQSMAAIEGERKKERERWATAGGLGSTSPWWDAVIVIMEAHAQALADRHTRSRPAWPARRSAINDKATVSLTMSAWQRWHRTGLAAA